MTNPEQTIHPLFDPASLYRLTTQYSVWNDQGKASIRSFFEKRRRDELYRDWMFDKPEQPQNWGYSEQLNEAIHQHLSGTDVPSLAEVRSDEARNRQLGVSGIDMPHSPVVAKCDLSTGDVGRPRVVSGIDFPESEIDSFDLTLAGFPAGHPCLLMILSRQLIELLAGWLDSAESKEEISLAFGEALPRRKMTSHDEPLEIIEQVFAADVMEPRRPAEQVERYRRAGRLATLLSNAPGFEQVADETGMFKVHVDLEQKSPSLDASSWLACFIGPRP